MRKLALLVLLASSCAGRRPAVKPDAPVAGICLETLETERTRSPLVERQGVGAVERYAAEAIDPTRNVAVKATESHTIGGQPLLWLTADKTALVVDKRFFGELTVADPTHMTEGQTALVGQLTPDGRDKLRGRALLRFLIAAEAIRTYWHSDATLCLEREREEAGAYEAELRGVHTYYTNQKNERRFAFTFRVTPDGTITVALAAAAR